MPTKPEINIVTFPSPEASEISSDTIPLCSTLSNIIPDDNFSKVNPNYFFCLEKSDGLEKSRCQKEVENMSKFLYKSERMYCLEPDVSEEYQVHNRTSEWLSSNNFFNLPHKHNVDTNLPQHGLSDITSVTKPMNKVSNGLIVEERTDEIKCGNDNEEISNHLVQNLHFPLVEQKVNRTASSSHFLAIEKEQIAVVRFCFVHTIFFSFYIIS